MTHVRVDFLGSLHPAHPVIFSKSDSRPVRKRTEHALKVIEVVCLAPCKPPTASPSGTNAANIRACPTGCAVDTLKGTNVTLAGRRS